ncbi:MAG: hypothetical protein ABJA89_03350 [Lapillicoccus sp.]
MTRPTTRLTAALGAVALAAGLSGCASIAGVTDAPTATVGGALAASQAQALAAQVVQTAQKAAAAPGADGDALRDTVYTGDALVAAKADAKLAPTLTQEQKNALTLTAAAPTVLAVSSGEAYPRVMVVQTTRATSGLPVLSLLTTPDARTPFKIAVGAPMLPSSEVPAFDQLTQGAPVLGDDATGLATDPEKLLAAYAASLSFPAPAAAAADPPFGDDAFAARLRQSAKAQNDALSGVGTFTQQHQAKDVVGGLRLAGGKGALVFAVMTRKDTLLNRTQGTITPSPQFQALTGLTSIKAEAVQDSLELVLFVVPDSGRAQVVGAEEHLVSASGT